MLRLHAASSSCTQHVTLRLHAASSSCTQHVMLRLHAASSSCTQHVMLRFLSEVDPKLSKKAGIQVIDRKWKALKDFLPSNYHRKINGPHGSQVNPLMRKRVFQFCWRNSLQKKCHLCLTSDFQWAEYLDNGFVTGRLMVPWPSYPSTMEICFELDVSACMACRRVY